MDQMYQDMTTINKSYHIITLKTKFFKTLTYLNHEKVTMGYFANKCELV